MEIILGGVHIGTYDVPNSVSLDAGSLKNTVLYTSNGRKILKITGNDEDDITLDGDLREVDRHGTPRQKSDALVTLRRAGKPVRFSFGQRSLQVTITDYVPQILMGNAITYHLVLSLAINGTPPASATLSTQEVIDRHTQTMTTHADNVGSASAAAANTAAAKVRLAAKFGH